MSTIQREKKPYINELGTDGNGAGLVRVGVIPNQLCPRFISSKPGPPYDRPLVCDNPPTLAGSG